MVYTTQCTCSEMQLHHVGCDCDMTGPVRVVLSYDEQVAADDAAVEAYFAAERDAEIAYWTKVQAEEAAAEAKFYGMADPREDFAEYTLEAVRYM